MDKETKENWIKIKDHFETLPEEQRDNWFYKRAVAIVGDEPDILPDLDLAPSSLED